MPPTSLPDVLVSAAHRGRSAVRHVLADLGGAPLSQGDSTTFLYFGAADDVRLVHWMDVFPPIPPFERLHGTDLWWLTLDLPHHARIEYRLRIVKGDGHRQILDPLNPLRADNPFGVNSIVAGPGYQRPEWSLPNTQVTPGTITKIELQNTVFGHTRTVGLYRPSAGGTAVGPLVVFHDGSDYVEFAALTTVLDNLIAAGDIPALAAALIDPGDRNVEYTGHDLHADHLVRDVLPAVEELIEPTRRVVMGASLGAVASLHAAWSHPGVFDAAVLQSGSFATGLGGRFRRGSIFKPVVEFLGRFHGESRPLPPSIYVSCGRFEGMLTENSALVDQLRSRHVDVQFDVTPDGHDWGAWRNRMKAAFEHTVGAGPASNR